MIELVQFPWSPFCLVQRRILEYSGAPFKTVNIPSTDRTLVWKLTKERYYGVPVIKDGGTVVFELSEETQVIAKYLDSKLAPGLFPQRWEGVQSILWRHIEGQIEDVGFRLNDIYWRERTPKGEQMNFVRHKERKFGRGCLDRWRNQQKELLELLEDRLIPFEEMLLHQPFLLGDRPHFVDFDLWGMLANFLFSGHYELPAAHDRLKDWYGRFSKLEISRDK